MKTFLILFLTMIACGVHAQSNIIDSLQKILQTEKEDTNKVNTLNELSWNLAGVNSINNALVYANQALSLAEKTNFKKGEGSAFYNLGDINANQNNLPEALKNYFTALSNFKGAGDKLSIAETYGSIGQLYAFRLDDYFEALKFYNSALKILAEIRSKKTIVVYSMIGSAYFALGNYSETLKNYYAALKLAEEFGDTSSIAGSLRGIGDCYSNQGNYSEAMKNFQASLKIFYKEEDKISIANTHGDIGNTYVEMGKYSEALQEYLTTEKIFKEPGMPEWGIALSRINLAYLYTKIGESASQSGDKMTSKEKFYEAQNEYLSTLKIYKKMQSKAGISLIYSELGGVNLKLNNFSLAKKYLDEGLQLSELIGAKEIIKSCFNNLAKFDSAQENYKQAFEHYKMYILYRDSINNEENTKKSMRAEMQYVFDKKEDSTKAAQEKKDALSKAEIKNQKTIRKFSYAGTAALLGFAGIGFYRFRKRKKLQSRQEMLNERLRISRELHDDIGSTLGSISIYSEVAKNRAEKKESSDEVLSKIGTTSRELIDKMSDIVWSLNPNNESFEQLQHRMTAFAAMILAPRDIVYDFIVNDELKKILLTAEQRKNIFLIFKETVYNVAKYADCKKVNIILNVENDIFTMIIKDDGKGFDINTNNSYNGNGIKNMKERAKEIGAKLNIISNKNLGTSVELIAPI